MSAIRLLIGCCFCTRKADTKVHLEKKSKWRVAEELLKRKSVNRDKVAI